MNRLFLTGLVVSSVFFGQCCKKKKSVAKNEMNIEVVEETPEASIKLSNNVIHINPAYAWPGSTDAFNIESQEVKGDSLIIEVQYGGGCKEHEFRMNTNLAWMKSLPPKLNLWLEHECNDDMCRALVYQRLAYDLRPIRYSASESVLLIVNGEEEKATLYRYN